MRLVISLVVTAMAASTVWAEPTQMFPLTGADLPRERRGTVGRLTHAIADSIDAEVSHVAIEDAGGLLECDVEATSCLELVSKSVGNKQLVYGSVVQGKGSILKVTLIRFRPGHDRQTQTYEITGETEAYADELVRKAAPLFGGTPPEAIEPKPDDRIETKPGPVDEPAAGTISVSTWGLIGGGALGLAIGIGFRVSANGIADEVHSFPDPETRDDFDRLTELEDRGKWRTRASVALIAVGGGVLVAGIVRAVVQRRSHVRNDERVIGVIPIHGGAALTISWELR